MEFVPKKIISNGVEIEGIGFLTVTVASCSN
jgi:hypothetical protein